MHKSVAVALITGSLLTGGAVGTALLGGGMATAQSSSSDSQSSQSDTPADRPDRPHHGPHGRPNLALAANAIGITEDELRTALQSDQSVADVATAHGVDPQTVIDALVADAQAKLAERVANGEITQAQADEINANLVERITDFVNRTGPPPGGPGCEGKRPGGLPPAEEGSNSSSGSSGSGTAFNA